MKKDSPRKAKYRIDLFLRKIIRQIMRLYYNSIYIRIFPDRHFFCRAIFNGFDFFVMCNGDVFCCCEFGTQEMLGNVHDNTMEEIWMNEKYEKLRESFRRNKLPMYTCSKCIGKMVVPKSEVKLDVANYLWCIHLETTIKCNLDCSFCHREFIENQRGMNTLKPEKVYELLDEIIKKRETEVLIWVGFGEPFIDKKLYEYISYTKERYPELLVSSSSNAIVFSKMDNARKMVQSQMDLLIISIDGPTEEIYLRYRKGGNFNRALQGLKNLAEAKKEAGLAKPTLVWQYILFNWNDKDWMLEKTIQTAKDMGVDILHFLPTISPISGISYKYVTKPYYGMIYRFTGPEHEYNPHNRAKVIEMFNQ